MDFTKNVNRFYSYSTYFEKMCKWLNIRLSFKKEFTTLYSAVLIKSFSEIMLWWTNNKNGRNIKKMTASKRTRKKEEIKNFGQTNCIMVQKINPRVAGKLSKYESLEAREFVDLKNVAKIC